MRGIITKIDEPKPCRDGNGSFRRVWITVENRLFAKTDLVIGFRNFARWQKVLKVGAEVEGLELIEPKKLGELPTIDADSPVSLIKEEISIMPGVKVIIGEV